MPNDTLAGHVALTDSEIAAALEPYVVRRIPAAADEWRDLYRKQLRKWRRRLWRGRLRALRITPARPQQEVRDTYTQSWQKDKHAWSALGKSEEIRECRWHDEGLLLRLGGPKRVYQRLLWRALSELSPRSVLEVGAGTGLNLLCLSTAFPGVSWAGLELTPSGVARAKAAQQEPELLPEIASYCSWPVVAPAAYRQIDFRQGDARKLPFADGSFDLVFSALALEQMEAIRDTAIAEMARVAARWVVFVEPFADFNRDPLRHAYTRAKGYFSLKVGELPRFGLQPMTAVDDIPQNIHIAYGLVTTRKQAKA